jgi:hypothetical protein
MRVALLSLALVALAGCGGDDSFLGDEALPQATPPSGAGGSGGRSGIDVDPCTLLSDDELEVAFANVEDLAEVPPPARTSPGGTTEMCSWQDILANAILRVELDTIGVIRVPPADPSCSEVDCPDPGLGVASRADLREVFNFVIVQLDGINLEVQAAGLDLTGDELVALAASIVDRLEG